MQRYMIYGYQPYVCMVYALKLTHNACAELYVCQRILHKIDVCIKDEIGVSE